MNLVEAARKGAEMVDGINRDGNYLSVADESVLACAVGAAYVAATGETNTEQASYWLRGLLGTNNDLARAVYCVTEYNDEQAKDLTDAIDHLEHNYPELAQLPVM